MNILTKLTSSHNRLLFLGLAAISTGALCYAFFVQYILGFEPCFLCLYERIPYFALILLGIGGMVVKNNKYILALVILALLAAVSLAGYHTGIERGLFMGTERCTSNVDFPEDATADEIRELLYDKPIADCSRPAYKIFGISMTEWNLLLNLGLLGVVLLVARRRV